MNKPLLGLTLTASLLTHTAFAEDLEAIAFREAFLSGKATWEDVQAQGRE